MFFRNVMWSHHDVIRYLPASCSFEYFFTSSIILTKFHVDSILGSVFFRKCHVKSSWRHQVPAGACSFEYFFTSSTYWPSFMFIAFWEVCFSEISREIIMTSSDTCPGACFIHHISFHLVPTDQVSYVDSILGSVFFRNVTWRHHDVIRYLLVHAHSNTFLHLVSTDQVSCW